MKIIVLGAGIIGVTTAYFLSSAGHEVFVIDKAKSPGLAASFANGGQLSYCYTDSLANPDLLRQLPKLLRGQEPFFDLKLSYEPALWFWGLRFLRNCTKKRAIFNSENILRLALYSRQMLHQILTLHSIEFSYQQNGKLLLYTNEAAFKATTPYVNTKNQQGCQQQFWNAQTCLAKEPTLQHLASQIAGGIFSPIDESGDSYQFTRALAERCIASSGVHFLYDTEIIGLDVKKGRIHRVKTVDESYSADAFVICLGAESSLISQTIGIKLPIYPLKGYSISVPITAGTPSINITDMHHKMVYSRLGNQLRIAGLLEMCGYDTSIDETKVQYLVKIAQASFPEAGDYSQVTSWAGLRAGTPDSAPLLGWTRYPNLYLNTGHGMFGWTLACGSAAIVADIINETSSAIDLTGLTMRRFCTFPGKDLNT
jgi:D-amino-acid dehydrogenase